MSATISACVIARDEEQRLPECLQSLDFCDETIVVDSGSRDRTREIAAEAGARVIENPWPGFAAQRNVALDAAKGDWILELDADERVTPELAREIRALLEDVPNEVRMTAIPSRDLFLGRVLGPSSRYPGYRHRLYRRGAFRHDEERTVHEGLWPNGSTPVLQGEFHHLLASSWGEAIRDAINYARLDAEQHTHPGPREALAGIVVRPVAKFVYRTFIYGGWRDGWQGLVRVGLECAADSLATALRLRRGSGGGASGLGQEDPRQGSVRLVGVCFDRKATEEMVAWLGDAAQAGADVALISRQATSGGSVVGNRALDGRGPGALARALDAEDQARPIDALVLGGRRERRFLRLAPRALRGVVEPLTREAPAREAVRDVQRATRPVRPA